MISPSSVEKQYNAKVSTEVTKIENNVELKKIIENILSFRNEN